MQVNEYTKKVKKREIKKLQNIPYGTSDERSPNCHLKFSHCHFPEIHKTAAALVMPITYHRRRKRKSVEKQNSSKKKPERKQSSELKGRKFTTFEMFCCSVSSLDTPEGSHSSAPLKHLYGVLAEAPHELLLVAQG